MTDKTDHNIEKLQSEYDALAKQTTAVAPDPTYGGAPTPEFFALKAKKKAAFEALTAAKRAAEKKESDARRAALNPPAPPTVPDTTVGKPATKPAPVANLPR